MAREREKKGGAVAMGGTLLQGGVAEWKLRGVPVGSGATRQEEERWVPVARGDGSRLSDATA
jgi:hypothetical protein